MFNKKVLLIGASSLIFLGACNGEPSANGFIVTPGSIANRYEVSEEKWNELFNLENFATQLNCKLDCVYLANNWESSITFDNGKMIITGSSSGANVEQGASIEPIETKNYEYYKVNSIVDGVMDYDNYYYSNGWKVQNRSYRLEEFFRGFGVLPLKYNKFTYNESNHEYVGTFSFTEDYANYMLSVYDVKVTFLDNKINTIKYSQAFEGQTDEIFYTYSQYDQVSVILPEVNS